jgi:hypothetical protein
VPRVIAPVGFTFFFLDFSYGFVRVLVSSSRVTPGRACYRAPERLWRRCSVSFPFRFGPLLTSRIRSGTDVAIDDFGPIAELENRRGFVRAASPFSIWISCHFSSHPSPSPPPVSDSFLLYHFMLRYHAASTLDALSSGILPFRSRLGAKLASPPPLQVGIPLGGVVLWGPSSELRRRSGGVSAPLYGTILL